MGSHHSYFAACEKGDLVLQAKAIALGVSFLGVAEQFIQAVPVSTLRSNVWVVSFPWLPIHASRVGLIQALGCT